MDMKSTQTLLSEIKTDIVPINMMDYLAAGYTVSNIESTFSKYDENTRFVIVEKYPEKEIWIQSGEVMVKTMYINIKLIPPVKHIELNITIDKDGKIQQ
jgi:hypothetical protein